jgi:hypothetical protein
MARAPGGGGYDADAQPYIDALALLGIVDATLNDAWNDFVVSAKADGYWGNFTAVYPFGGGTAAAHAINAKNPGTYDITWAGGGGTHNANGFTPNGSTSYGNTGINASSVLTFTDCHISTYSRTTVLSLNQIDIGAEVGGGGRLYISPATSLNDFQLTIGNGATIIAGSQGSDTLGQYLVTRRGTTDSEAYKNGSSIGTNGVNSGSLPNLNITIGALNYDDGNRYNFSSRNLAFASIGAGLTDTEAANFYSAVQAFQTTLGRQV